MTIRLCALSVVDVVLLDTFYFFVAIISFVYFVVKSIDVILHFVICYRTFP